jgi:hypothetical protein
MHTFQTAKFTSAEFLRESLTCYSEVPNLSKSQSVKRSGLVNFTLAVVITGNMHGHKFIILYIRLSTGKELDLIEIK